MKHRNENGAVWGFCTYKFQVGEQMEQTFSISSDKKAVGRHGAHHRSSRRKSRRHRRELLKKRFVQIALLALAFIIIAAVAYFIIGWTASSSTPSAAS